ncbi:MAG: DNA-processing protein DprA, partial [Hyphomicrobium sp.]
MDRLGLSAPGSVAQAVSPLLELGAYEALWDEKGATFKTLSERFEKERGALPSDFVPASRARAYADYVVRRFKETGVTHFGVRVHGAGEYPDKLRDAAHPVEVLYYR